GSPWSPPATAGNGPSPGYSYPTYPTQPNQQPQYPTTQPQYPTTPAQSVNWPSQPSPGAAPYPATGPYPAPPPSSTGPPWGNGPTGPPADPRVRGNGYPQGAMGPPVSGPGGSQRPYTSGFYPDRRE